MAQRYDIFLSYRHSDGRDIARALKETLENRGYRVFLDMDELQDGVFDKRILDAIQSAPIYLILLTPRCLERCHIESDWVRQEIDYALQHRKQIIPINPDKLFTGFPDTTPPHIRRGLSQHQYSALDTGQLYQVSINQLVTRRLEPVFRRRRTHMGLIGMLTVLFLSVLLLVGYRYYQHHQPVVYYQQGVAYNQVGLPSYNRDSALYYLQLAANMDYAPAQRDLGQLYQFSIDVNKHKDWSFYWLKKAYLNGDTLSAALLGYNYQYGIGIPEDISQAIALYQEGVAMQDAYACYLLGSCLCQGIGLTKDYVQGMQLIAQSAEMNNAWGILSMHDAGRWIFSPAIDSTAAASLTLRAICLSDTATTLYLRWTNQQFVGGYMQIHPQTCLYASASDTRYPLQSISDCRMAPDTTAVAWGAYHDFSLSFAPLPDSVYSISFVEPAPSDWVITNISLR